jgi:hypothetical protein
MVNSHVSPANDNHWAHFVPMVHRVVAALAASPFGLFFAVQQ